MSLNRIFLQAEEPIIIGGDLGQIENLRWMLRSPFDANVVAQYGYQEVLLDYVLANLGTFLLSWFFACCQPVSLPFFSLHLHRSRGWISIRNAHPSHGNSAEFGILSQTWVMLSCPFIGGFFSIPHTEIHLKPFFFLQKWTSSCLSAMRFHT